MSSISETCDLIEDVATEFLERRQQGDRPSIEDYAARYPELSDEIHDLFPVIEALDEVHRNARQSAARDATAKPLRLTELGDFKILREIGRGGMGIVYEAEQRIGYDIADALQHAVDQGVLHRDVKPGNLLFDRHGKVWVTDFGLAQALNANETKAYQSIAGTLNYISPEGFLGNYGPQGDIYSLGLTLY
ncbi:unnamed protein product, partial [Symbiodinium microadriaticum]